MEDVALGTKVFTRAEKLRGLLNSVANTDIGTVYVADDGDMNDVKRDIYDTDYPFKLVVIDLEYDAGLGYGRKRIVEEMSEEYLVIVDSDHIIPSNIHCLKRQLDTNTQLGGVSGMIFEPEHEALYIEGQHIKEDGGLIERGPGIKENKVRSIAGYPFIEFDLIPNASMFKRKCVEDYTWDEEYVIGYEHIDFYVGHLKQTDWKFGVCPSVIFKHFPGGDQNYKSNRGDSGKLSDSKKYFMNKWAYSGDVNYGFRLCQVGKRDVPPLQQRIMRVYREEGIKVLLRKAFGKIYGTF